MRFQRFLISGHSEFETGLLVDRERLNSKWTIGRNNNSQVKRSEPGRAERVTSNDNGLHWPSLF